MARSVPRVAAGGAETGVLGGLRSLWDKVVAFFRNLFGPGSGAPAAPVGSWPAYNPDARMQLYQMVPTGTGTALGFVPVRVWREGYAIRGSATGFGGGSLFWSGNEMFYQEGNKSPVRIAAASSTRDAAGETRFEATLESGKRIEASVLADGRTVRHRGYQVTFY